MMQVIMDQNTKTSPCETCKYLHKIKTNEVVQFHCGFSGCYLISGVNERLQEIPAVSECNQYVKKDESTK